ncbi:MAG: ABC transporter ATP-binding protein [Candidatus Xenobiia bacterium LiM19]
MIKKTLYIINKTEFARIIGIVFLSIILSFSEVLSVGIILPIMGLFLNPNLIEQSSILKYFYTVSGLQNHTSFLIVMSITAIVIFCLKLIYSIIIQFRLQRLVCAIDLRLKCDILDYYLSREYEFHLINNSSTLFKNIIAEINNFTTYIIMPFIQMTSEILAISGIAIFMLILYPSITILLMLFVVPSMLLINIMMKRRLKKYAKDKILFSEKFYKVAFESFQAIKEIKIYNVYKTFVAHFHDALKKYNDSYVKSNTLLIIPGYFLQATLFSSVLIVIIISTFFSMSYKEIIPMMTIIVLIALRLIPSFSKISLAVNSFNYSFNSLDLVYNIIRDYKTMQAKSTKILSNAQEKKQSIVLENIDFQYESASTQIFENINISVQPCKTTALIGKTGSGKSTLIDIIMALLTPSQGLLYYNGIPISDSNAVEYRKQIGYVPQDIALIDDTISANIAFGIEPELIDENRIENIIGLTQLEEYIKGLPDGVLTMVGEKGVRLSGGQRQRIALARALYLDPPILILDEATSALDIETERQIYTMLKKLNKTIIMITHRLSTLCYADMIYVLDAGKIIDKGSYQELRERITYMNYLKQDYNSITNENS